MSDKVKIFTLCVMVFTMMAIVFVSLGGMLGYQRAISKCQMVQPDTIYVRDTASYGTYDGQPFADSVIKEVPVPVPYPVPKPYNIDVHDTIVDSIPVYLPMEWKHAYIENKCDIYYHGIMAGIDSTRFYFTSTVINSEIVKYQRPKFGLEVGMGMTYIPINNKAGGYAITKASYNTGRCSFGLFAAYHTEGIPAFGGQITYQIINPR